MRTKAMLAAFLMLATSVMAYAGGPPPVYVVVSKVVLDSSSKQPGTLQIWGYYSRMNINKDGSFGEGYTKPTYGYIYLSIKDFQNKEFQADLKDWQSAAGTGKAVAVGSCGDAGAMLKSPIHDAKEQMAKPDAEYTTGKLKLFGDLFARGDSKHEPHVAALIKYANEQKQ